MKIKSTRGRQRVYENVSIIFRHAMSVDTCFEIISGFQQKDMLVGEKERILLQHIDHQ